MAFSQIYFLFNELVAEYFSTALQMPMKPSLAKPQQQISYKMAFHRTLCNTEMKSYEKYTKH